MTTCSWSFVIIIIVIIINFVHNHFLCKNLNAVCAHYLIIFWDLLTFFLAIFFQKQASKDHLTQGNLLKAILLNGKQSNLEKEMHESISLYYHYFTSIRNIFATIRLPSFSTNIDKNDVCAKKINQIFKKTNAHSPLYIKKLASLMWLINYFVIGNFVCVQISMY